MAAYTTVLKQFSDMGNVRKWSTPGHTIAAPRLLTQKRQEATSPTGVARNSLTFLGGATDANDTLLEARNVIDISVRGPVNGKADEMTALVAVMRDIINSDDFADMVASQAFLDA
jgi:hypothetical protein